MGSAAAVGAVGGMFERTISVLAWQGRSRDGLARGLPGPSAQPAPLVRVHRARTSRRRRRRRWPRPRLRQGRGFGCFEPTATAGEARQLLDYCGRRASPSRPGRLLPAGGHGQNRIPTEFPPGGRRAARCGPAGLHRLPPTLRARRRDSKRVGLLFGPPHPRTVARYCFSRRIHAREAPPHRPLGPQRDMGLRARRPSCLILRAA